MRLTQRRTGAKKRLELSKFLLCAFAPLRFPISAFLLVFVAQNGVRAAEDPPAFAESRDDSKLYDVKTLISGLDNPASIAVRPGSRPAGPFELYISESGAGRVVRLVTDKPSETSRVITGFPLGSWGEGPTYRVGPLGLDFLSRNRLVVGTGGLGVGADLVRVYTLPDGHAELAFDAVDHVAGPVSASGRSTSGEGGFYSIAHADNALFVAPASGDEQGWVLKAIVDANRVAGLEPFLATRALAGVGVPGAVTIDPKPNHRYLVVSQLGALTAARDSRVGMYSPASGELALNLETGLYDIVALAYSPTGDLYAIDFASADAMAGGVYRLEAAPVEGRESCRAVKLAAAVRPTSLAFTPDGTLYVTAFGERTDQDEAPTGVLLQITPKAGGPKL